MDWIILFWTFYRLYFWCHIRKLCLEQIHVGFPIYFSRSFIVLGFKIRSLINFELFWIWWSKAFCFACGYPIFQSNFFFSLKDCPFFTELPLHFCPYMWEFCFRSLQSVPPICLCLHQYHIILMAVAIILENR